MSGGGGGHVGEGGLYGGGFCPDGNVLHGVVVGDLGLGESVGLSGWGEGVDGSDGAVAVAEAGGETGSGGGGGVAAGVDAHLFTFGEELRGDEGVELLAHGWVGGFEGEARWGGEEAVGVLQEVGVEGGSEVFRGGSGFGFASGEDDEGGDEGGGSEERGGSADSGGLGHEAPSYC